MRGNSAARAPAASATTSDYLATLNGMVYGEDPSEGFVRGRRFVHPKLGFTFQAPPGFSLDNTAEAVLGLKNGGGEALRLDVVSVPPEQTLGAYLKSGWMENVDAASVQETTVNGFPAATATSTGEGWSFRLYAIRYGSDVYRFIFAARERSAQSDRSFRDSVSTFRRMSLKEALAGQAAAPRRRHGRRARYGGELGQAHGGREPCAGDLPRAQRAGAERQAQGGPEGQDRGGVRPRLSAHARAAKRWSLRRIEVGRRHRYALRACAAPHPGHRRGHGAQARLCPPYVRHAQLSPASTLMVNSRGTSGPQR